MYYTTGTVAGRSTGPLQPFPKNTRLGWWYGSLPLVEVFGLRKRELCAQFQTSETFEAAAIEIAASLIHTYIYTTLILTIHTYFQD